LITELAKTSEGFELTEANEGVIMIASQENGDLTFGIVSDFATFEVTANIDWFSLFGHDGPDFFGFTAATGGVSNVHVIFDWNLNMTLLVPVSIDVHPGDNIGCLNIDGKGKVPVAILGSDTLDVSDVNPMSLDFNSLKVSVKKNGKYDCAKQYVNNDGFYDLVCLFVDSGAGDWVETKETFITLTGSLYDGTLLEGGDTVCVRVNP